MGTGDYFDGMETIDRYDDDLYPEQFGLTLQD